MIHLNWILRSTPEQSKLVRVLLVWWLIASTALGCPLCEALSGTLADDLKDAKFAVIASAGQCTQDPATKLFRTEFASDRRIGLKGSAQQVSELPLETYSVDELQMGADFLLIAYSQECPTIKAGEGEPVPNAAEPVELAWTSPLLLSKASKQYLVNTPPKESTEEQRLIFFFDHLLSEDALVRDDAYNECARTSLTTMRSKAFRDHVDLNEISRRLADQSVSPKSKCFYWMLMAELGKAEHVSLFEELALPHIEKSLALRASDNALPTMNEHPIWLAASIAAYCSIAAENEIRGHGLERIDKLILDNRNASQSLKYTAISALRVLGDDIAKVPVSRVAQSMALILNDPDSADFVIANLARWKHWESLPKLVKLFDESDVSQSLVRMPIINFMRVCPLPDAERELVRMKQRDPSAYRRAVSMFPTINAQITKSEDQ